MKFFLDMPLSEHTAKWLRDRGFDVVHARERGLSRAPDEEILRQASRDGRILLTMDLDIPAILASTKAEEPGVILFRMRDPRPPLIHQRLDFFLRSHQISIASTLTVIEDSRIRVRKLPIF